MNGLGDEILWRVGVSVDVAGWTAAYYVFTGPTSSLVFFRHPCLTAKCCGQPAMCLALSLCVSVCLSACLAVSLRMSLCLCLCLPVSLSVCLFVCLSVSRLVWR